MVMRLPASLGALTEAGMAAGQAGRFAGMVAACEVALDILPRG